MRIIICLIVLLPATVSLAEVTPLNVDHGYVAGLAQKLAAAEYDTERGEVPKSFRRLNYNDYRKIRFRPERSLWGSDDLGYRVQFFHPGYIFDRTVDLHEFSSGYVQEIPFVRDHFDYRNLKFPFWAKWGLSYAGFRMLNQLNEPGKWDEVVSFLGSSYFRALAKGQFYGISARGLALNAGGQGPEEFPRFVEFWLGKPEKDANTVVVHGLLDSPSVAGAYTFVIKPGDETVMDVRATLYFRTAVPSVGVAPLTSMFWFGEMSPNRFGDFRPEVHDSDGLLIAVGEQTRIWRPLQNHTAMQITNFPVKDLKGFGLLQRDREFSNYQDLEARYELRPSVWVEPVGEWPAGIVRLMELVAGNEHHDNIVAYWTPRQMPMPDGKPVELAWRLHWTNALTFGGPSGYVQATRRTIEDGEPGRTHFVIDYAPGSMSQVDLNEPPEAEIHVPDGVKVTEQQVLRNTVEGAWRLSLRLAAKPGVGPQLIEARLMNRGQPISETWSLLWTP